jgi:hypothetical protein
LVIISSPDYGSRLTLAAAAFLRIARQATVLAVTAACIGANVGQHVPSRIGMRDLRGLK